MFFSVVIPVYNKEKYISNSINSILQQSFGDYEVIAVDDGSTDDSIKVLSSYGDERIRIVSQKNAGPSAARNHGVRAAKGEWILFLDADDEFLPGAFEHFHNLSMTQKGINCFVCNRYTEMGGKKKLIKFYSDGEIANPYRLWVFDRLHPCQGAIMLRKDVARKYPYPENLRRWEDAAMIFEIMRNERFYRSHIPVAMYHLGSAELSKRAKCIDEDFLGHLDVNGKSFWERMCLYRMYKEAVRLYPVEAHQLYGDNFADVWVRAMYNSYTMAMSLAVKVRNLIKRR